MQLIQKHYVHLAVTYICLFVDYFLTTRKKTTICLFGDNIHIIYSMILFLTIIMIEEAKEAGWNVTYWGRGWIYFWEAFSIFVCVWHAVLFLFIPMLKCHLACRLVFVYSNSQMSLARLYVKPIYTLTIPTFFINSNTHEWRGLPVTGGKNEKACKILWKREIRRQVNAVLNIVGQPTQ